MKFVLKTCVRLTIACSLPAFFYLTLVRCGSAPKEEAGETPQKLSPPAWYQPASPTPLTKEGHSMEADVHPQGGKLLFVGSHRPDHDHTEVYEYNFETKKQRRITHQDGDILGPRYHPNGSSLVYASTTDSIKESPALLKRHFEPQVWAQKQNSEWLFKPYDVYTSYIDGSQIRRVTDGDDYEAEGFYSSTGNSLVYSRMNHDKRLELATVYLKRRRLRPRKLLNRDDFHLVSPLYSPKGKHLLWVEMDLSQKRSHIFVADDRARYARQITTFPALHWTPQWHPDGQHIVFASNRDATTPDNFELYTVDIKGLCLKRLTYHEAKDILPSFSPDGKSLIFTSYRQKQPQIYQMDYSTPSQCEDMLP